MVPVAFKNRQIIVRIRNTDLMIVLGQNAWWGARFLISFVEYQSRNILRMVPVAFKKSANNRPNPQH
jgi:Transmembrane protein 33/Nucleoporin POM33